MLIKRTCGFCSAEFEAARANALYCGDAHRNAAYRKRRAALAEAAADADSGETHGSPQDTEGIGVEQALAVELRDAKVEGTAMGQALMVVARRIDAGESGSSLASLVLRLGIELERTVGRAAAALAGGDALEDEVAKARARRDRTRSAR